MTVLHCQHLPGPPEPQQRRSSLSLAWARGIRKKSGMESKETYFFFRSWEQRGQNLKSDKEEQGKPKVSEACVRSSAQLWDSPSSSCHGSVTYHFPRGLVVSPTQAKWNHSMEHWKRQMEQSGQGPEQGWRREEPFIPAFWKLPASLKAAQSNHCSILQSLSPMESPPPLISALMPLRAPPPILRQMVLTSGLSQPIISP